MHKKCWGWESPLPCTPRLSSAQVNMKVDIIYEKDMLYLYVLSSIGGLLLLLLIFLVLYKVGASGRNGHTWPGWGKRNWWASGSRSQKGPQPTPPSTDRATGSKEQAREFPLLQT